MLCNGHLPIPLRGKAAFLNSWQNMTINQTVIDGWSDMFFNTGMRTSFAPVFDADILNEAGAAVVATIAERELGKLGKVVARVGQSPKRAYVMRMLKSFNKIIRKFRDPEGGKHKIEILCQGQQLAVAGAHPDTGEPFVWRDGDSVATIPYSQLPLVDEVNVQPSSGTQICRAARRHSPSARAGAAAASSSSGPTASIRKD
jgi:hypothetical protein